MPVVAGKHAYALTFRSGAAELKHAGEFTVLSGKHRGLVVRDPEHPTHFKWSGDEEHFFYNSS